MKTTVTISNGRLEIDEHGYDCYRTYHGQLGLYGLEQFKMYGSKETVAALIEHRFNITPGRYVRQLSDVLFFFPAKNGLTGSLATAEWMVEHCYIGPDNALSSFSICEPIPVQALRRFRHTVADWNDSRTPLLLYQYGELYYVDDTRSDGRFWLRRVADPYSSTDLLNQQ